MRGAQGERRDLAGVRRRPEVFTFMSVPDDTSQRLPPYLRSRSLVCNVLGPEGGAAVAEGLKGNSTLEVLE